MIALQNGITRTLRCSVAFAIISAVIRFPFRGAFVILAGFGCGTSDILRIRSRDPSFFARARGSQEYAGIEPADTRSEPGPYIFGRCVRTSAKCSTVSAGVTINSASLELGTSEASQLKYSARPAFPITAQLLFPSRLEPGTSKYRFPPSSSRRLRPFVFVPLPLLPVRHCCLRYLPQFLKLQPIPKFQNVPVV